MSFVAAALKPLEWLLGTNGNAVLCATYHTASWSDLGKQIESAVRATYPRDTGVEIHVTERPTYLIQAHRGMTGGFSIQIIPKNPPQGEAGVHLLINRWSRWHTWSVNLAAATFFLSLFAGVLLFAVARWDLPGHLAGYILLGGSFCAAVVVLRLIRPVLAAVEGAGGNRFADDEIGSVVEVVRRAIERTPGVSIAME